MSRYIDADKLQRDLAYRWYDAPKRLSGIKVSMLIDEQPTADVVEVVRCKDCKWFNNIGCAIKIVDDSDKPKDNDYCSFGERTDT